MKRKLEKNFELAELSIKNDSVEGFKQWLQNHDPEQRNRNGKTIVNVLVEDYIFKARNGLELHRMYEMLELLKETKSFKSLSPKTLFILKILCPNILFLGFPMQNESRYIINQVAQNIPKKSVQFAKDVYDAKSCEFDIPSLQRFNLPKLPQEQWNELLYGEEDFIVSYSNDWDVREKRSIKIGTALITYQYGGKGCLETIIERIDRNKKSTEIIFESEKMRRENTALPFEAYIPFSLQQSGEMTNVGGYEPNNYPETVKLLNETWKIKNKIAEMAKPENDTEAKWNELIVALKALSTTAAEEKAKNNSKKKNSYSISTAQETPKKTTKSEQKRQELCDKKIAQLDAALKIGIDQFEKIATTYSRQDRLYSRQALDALEKKYSNDHELLWNIALVSQKCCKDYEPDHLFKVLKRIIDNLHEKKVNNQEKIVTFLSKFADVIKGESETKGYFIEYIIRTISKMRPPKDSQVVIDLYLTLKKIMSFTSAESFEIDEQLLNWQLRQAEADYKSSQRVSRIIEKITDFLELHKVHNPHYKPGFEPEYFYQMRSNILETIIKILQRCIDKDTVMSIHTFYQKYTQPSVIFNNSSSKICINNACQQLVQSSFYREVNGLPPLPPSFESFTIETWKRETLAQRINVPIKVYQKEIDTLNSIVNQFKLKIDGLKGTNESPKVITIVEKLYKELNNAVRLYEAALLAVPTTIDETKRNFRALCAMSINNTKSLLEKEQGWGDYLTNLLKSLVNAIISATNTITGSSFTLFALAKAPMHSEIEAVEEEIADVCP